MFLDQDQMYLRMCNVNKEKISLENTGVVHSSAPMCSHLFIYLSTSYLFETIVRTQFLIIYIQMKKKKSF